MAQRTFAKPFVANLDGQTVRFVPGDEIDADIPEKLGWGDHLFTDGDDGLAEKVRAAAEQQLAKANGAPAPAAKSLGDMSPAELKKYAADNGIDVGDASRKADLLAAISKAEAERAADEQAKAEAAAKAKAEAEAAAQAAAAANEQNAQ